MGCSSSAATGGSGTSAASTGSVTTASGAAVPAGGAFAAYALGFLGMGRLMDRIGVRKGFSFAIVAWSLAAMAHALARTAGNVSSKGD